MLRVSGWGFVSRHIRLDVAIWDAIKKGAKAAKTKPSTLLGGIYAAAALNFEKDNDCYQGHPLAQAFVPAVGAPSNPQRKAHRIEIRAVPGTFEKIQGQAKRDIASEGAVEPDNYLALLELQEEERAKTEGYTRFRFYSRRLQKREKYIFTSIALEYCIENGLIAL